MSRNRMDVARLLRAEFPELDFETVEPLGEGWDHAAFLADGELVFRVHECVFGVLALESEPVDPRL